MKTTLESLLSVDERLNCFGGFRPEDPICRKHCIVNLRCIVERDQNTRMDLLEELLAAEGQEIKIQ